MYFTHHPLEWEDYIDEKYGKDLRIELREKALNHIKEGKQIDYEELIEQLKEELSDSTKMPDV